MSSIHGPTQPTDPRAWADAVPSLALVDAAGAFTDRSLVDARVMALVPAAGARGRLVVAVDGPAVVAVTDEGIDGLVQGRSLLGAVPVGGPAAAAFHLDWADVAEVGPARPTGRRPGAPLGRPGVELLGTDPPWAVLLHPH